MTSAAELLIIVDVDVKYSNSDLFKKKCKKMLNSKEKMLVKCYRLDSKICMLNLYQKLLHLAGKELDWQQ